MSLSQTAKQIDYQLFYSPKMDKSKQNEGEMAFDQSLLKSKREHYEKETEKLLDSVLEDYSELDKMSIFGKKFREKEIYMQTIIKENEQLRQKTFNMTKEIQNLRMSLGDSGVRYTNMLNEIQKTERDEIVASKFMIQSINESTQESIRLKLEQIQRSHQQVRKDYQEFDEMLHLLIKYITREKAADKLREEIEPSKQRKIQGIQMISVPKERYEKLINIYSWNIAEITVSQMLKSRSAIVGEDNIDSSFESIEKGQKIYIQTYGNLFKGQNVDLSDLNQLFGILSKKLSLEEQWQKYHSKNKQKAIAFHSEISKIMAQKYPSITQSQQKQSLLKKIGLLTQSLSFTPEQKQIWTELEKKIRLDELITYTNLINEVQLAAEKKNKFDSAKLSQILALTLKISMEKIQELFKKKFQGKYIQNWTTSKEFDAKTIEKEIGSKYSDALKAFQIIFKKKLAEVYVKIEKNLIFISNKTIQNVSCN